MLRVSVSHHADKKKGRYRFDQNIYRPDCLPINVSTPTALWVVQRSSGVRTVRIAGGGMSPTHSVRCPID